MDQAGIFLFDFVGYPVEFPVSNKTHGSFQLSIREVFFMYKEQEIIARQAQMRAAKIELAFQQQAKTFNLAEAYRKRWANTYTVLLSEI